MEMTTILSKNLQKGKFWTEAWSLVEGCTPVSPGCANCWLAQMHCRNLPNLTKSVINPGSKAFNGIIKCHEERLDNPLRATRPRVYAVWSDLFHEDVPREFILKAFSTIARTKQHHFIIVTKRPARAVEQLGRNGNLFPNVTIMVTIEDQERAEERASQAHLLSSLGWRTGALCEPLLGHVDLSKWLRVKDPIMPSNAFDWIITGGESGPNARPTHPEWFRSLREQAAAAGVPFLFKQWGEWAPRSGAITGGGTDFGSLDPQCKRWPKVIRLGENGKNCRISENCEGAGEEVFMQMVGKKLAGNVLDGAVHVGLPVEAVRP